MNKNLKKSIFKRLFVTLRAVVHVDAARFFKAVVRC